MQDANNKGNWGPERGEREELVSRNSDFWINFSVNLKMSINLKTPDFESLATNSIGKENKATVQVKKNSSVSWPWAPWFWLLPQAPTAAPRALPRDARLHGTQREDHVTSPISHLQRGGNWGPERWGDWPRVTWMIRDRFKAETPAFCFQFLPPGSLSQGLMPSASFSSIA